MKMEKNVDELVTKFSLMEIEKARVALHGNASIDLILNAIPEWYQLSPNERILTTNIESDQMMQSYKRLVEYVYMKFQITF